MGGRLELVASVGGCPVAGCERQDVIHRVLRDTETKMPISRGTWYNCPGHPYRFKLPETMAEALKMHGEWLLKPNKRKGPALVIDSQ